jgi:ubiquinone/menaquinone biosynthesis C-methylase UbiE
MNKTIHREENSSSKIFDERTVEVDYATLIPILKEGLRVLDVGCGTGAISKGIADRVGKTGYVIGIDNTKSFIDRGKQSYKDVSNLELIHADLFDFNSEEKFDLIVSARVLQWLSNPKDALRKLKSMLRPNGQISILDYNHEELEWHPLPPASMVNFHKAFLAWREHAGMNNRIADDLSNYFKEVGFHSIEVRIANETYKKEDENFEHRAGIWCAVAELKQIVEEGYIEEKSRLQAIEEYKQWMDTEAESMTMKLKEVRGRI